MTETTIRAQDRSAIHDIMARYAWCLDRGDIDGLAARLARYGAGADGVASVSAKQRSSNP